MYSASTGPSLCDRGSGLPHMWWPLSRIRGGLLPVLVYVRGQRGRTEQCRRVWQQRKAAVVANGFARGVHACRGADATAHHSQMVAIHSPFSRVSRQRYLIAGSGNIQRFCFLVILKWSFANASRRRFPATTAPTMPVLMINR